MCEVKKASGEGCANGCGKVDVVWSRPWEDVRAFFRPRQLRPGVIVNSIGGLPQQVGQKLSLARLHVNCMRRAGRDPTAPQLNHELTRILNLRMALTQID